MNDKEKIQHPHLPMVLVDKPIRMYAIDIQGYTWAPVDLIAVCRERGHILKAEDASGQVYFNDELVADEDAAIVRVRAILARRIHALDHMAENAQMEYDDMLVDEPIKE